MENSNEPRNQRIDIRVSRTNKALLEAEADYRGLTLSAYLIHVAVNDALASLEKRKLLAFSQDDSRRFFDALESPAEPNDALRKAVKRYEGDVVFDE
jgi:uncharacterized protein (DUF1778 family)